MSFVADIVGKLRSDKARLRQEGINLAADAYETVLDDVSRQPKQVVDLLRALLAAIESDFRETLNRKSSDTIRARTEAARVRKSCELLHSVVENLAVWITRDQSSLLQDGDQRSPSQRPPTIIARALAKNAVPHILHRLENRGELAEACASAYVAALSKLVSIASVRHNISEENVALGLRICMRQALGGEHENDHDSGVFTQGRSVKPVTHRVLGLAHTFSRLLLCSPEHLTSLWRDASVFLHSFFLNMTTETSAHTSLLSALNFLLLRVINLSTDATHAFIIAMGPVLTPFWLTKSQAFRRELLQFSRIAFWATLGESLDPERTDGVVREMPTWLRPLWDKVLLDMSKGFPTVSAVLLRDQVSLGSRFSPYAAEFATPLFPSDFGVHENAILRDHALLAWAYLCVASECLVRCARLDALGVPDDAERSESKRRKQLSLLEAFIDVLFFAALRYGPCWASPFKSGIIDQLCDFLPSDDQEVYFWACVTLAKYIIPDSREAITEEVGQRIVRIHQTLQRRISLQHLSPTFYLMHAINVHYHYHLQQSIAVDPASVFTDVTCPCSPLLSYVIHVTGTKQAPWTALGWADQAVSWLFASHLEQQVDPDVLAAFLMVTCGNSFTLSIAPVVMAIPHDDVLFEHEFLSFITANKWIWNGMADPLRSMKSRFVVKNSSSYINVPLAKRILDDIRETLQRHDSIDTTLVLKLSVALKFLDFCVEEGIQTLMTIEEIELFKSIKFQLERVCGALCNPFTGVGDDLTMGISYLRLLGVSAQLFDMYLNLDVASNAPVVERLSCLYSTSLIELISSCAERTHDRCRKLMVAKVKAVQRLDRTGDSEFASSKAAIPHGPLLTESYHAALLEPLSPDSCTWSSFFSSLSLSALITNGKSSPRLPLDKEALSELMIGQAMCLLPASQPSLVSTTDLIRDNADHIVLDHAMQLFDFAYDLLESQQKDPSMESLALRAIATVFHIIATVKPSQMEEIAKEFCDLFSFFSDHLPRCKSHPQLFSGVFSLLEVSMAHRCILPGTTTVRIIQLLAKFSMASLDRPRLLFSQRIDTLRNFPVSAGQLMEIYRTIRPRVQEHDSFEDRMTATIFYDSIATKFPLLRTFALCELHKTFAEDHDLSVTIMEHIADGVGVPLHQFIADSHPDVIFEYIHRGASVSRETLPWQTIGQATSFEDYCRSYFPYLIIGKFLKKEFRVLDDLEEITKFSRLDLVSKSMSHILATILPMYYPPEGDVNDIPDLVIDQVKSILTSDAFDQQYARLIDNIIIRVIMSAWDENYDPEMLFIASEEVNVAAFRGRYERMSVVEDKVTACFAPMRRPYCSTSSVLRTLAYMAGQRSVALDKLLEPGVTLKLLQTVHKCLIQSVKSIHEHRYWIHIYKLSIALMPLPLLKHTFFSRFMVTTIVYTLEMSPLRLQILRVLRFVLESIGNDNVRYILSKVVPRLADILIHHPDLSGAMSEIIRASLERTRQLESVDLRLILPFREVPVLETLARWRSDFLSSLSLREDLETLVSYLSVMPENDSVKEQIEDRMGREMSPSVAQRIAKTLLTRKVISSKDALLLGKLYPWLLQCSLETPDERLAPSKHSQQVLEIIAQHFLNKLEDFDSASILQSVSKAVRSLPLREIQKVLPEEQADVFMLLAKPFKSSQRVLNHRIYDANDFSPNLWSSKGKTLLEWMETIIPILVNAQPDPLFYRVCDIMVRDVGLTEKLFSRLMESFVTAAPSHRKLISTFFSFVFENNVNEAVPLLQWCLDVLARFQWLCNVDDQNIQERLELELNYLAVAKTSERVKLPYEAIQYAERYHRNANKLSECLKEVEYLLAKLYKSVGEQDGFYGVNQGTSFEDNLSMFEHEQKWHKYLSLSESRMALKDAPREILLGNCMQALEHLGYQHLLLEIMLPRSSAVNVSASQYQCLWRNHRWDVNATPADQLGFHGHVFELMKALHEGQAAAFQNWLQSGLDDVVKKLKSDDTDVMLTLSTVATSNEFACLHALAEIFEEKYGTVAIPWDKKIAIIRESLDFEMVDLFTSIRTAVLTANQAPKETLLPWLIHHASLARKANRLHLSSKSLAATRALGMSLEETLTVRLAEAKLLWMNGDHQVAIRIAESVILHLPQGLQTSHIMAKCLNRTGKWHAMNRSKAQDTILSDYFEKAVVLDPANAKLRYVLGRYAQDQYEKLQQSETVEHLTIQRDLKLKDVEVYNTAMKSRKSTVEQQYCQQQVSRLLKQVSLDDEEIQRHAQLCNSFVLRAVENYLLALSLSSKYDMAVYAVCSLWLSHPGSPEVSRAFAKDFKRVPISKFLCLMTQLLARIGSKEDHELFQKSLFDLSRLMVQKYPHHTLYPLFALVNGGVVGYEVGKTYKMGKPLDDFSKARISYITHILKEFRASFPDIYAEYELLVKAYIELSYCPVDQRQLAPGQSIPMNASLLICKLNDLDHTAVATVRISPEDSEANRFPTIRRFAPEFDLVGGVNVPKAISCEGNNGKSYRQLVKGNDDLRQDATLMHVFDVADELLKQHKPTRQRDLGVRTYKVIPLAPKAGLLEWVTDTKPLTSVLRALHDRHTQRGQLTPDQCRKIMADEFERPRSSAKSKVDVFVKKLLPRIPPMFHLWFEQFPTAQEWFSKRLAFSRSCAANSIVGWIVGLGDRHSANILLDLASAQVIHIDLGVSFDFGKLLPIPELVPFRLTQEIVVALGVKGVDGVFRRCCEETLRVMRAEEKVLFTILEVLKHDPLHSWTIDPQKLFRMQRARTMDGGDPGVKGFNADQPGSGSSSMGSTRSNKEAERALLGVRRKLDARVSVECQVNDLIREATDPENLACMFHGWQSWL